MPNFVETESEEANKFTDYFNITPSKSLGNAKYRKHVSEALIKCSMIDNSINYVATSEAGESLSEGKTRRESGNVKEILLHMNNKKNLLGTESKSANDFASTPINPVSLLLKNKSKILG